jgi:sulfoxide reductase heme-binding subunit YedZ
MSRARIVSLSLGSTLLFLLILLMELDSEFAPEVELFLIQRTGQLALLFLFLTLLVSPLRRLLSEHDFFQNPSRLRSGLGIACACLATVHLAAVYNSGFIPNLFALITEPQWRNGLAAFLILVLLAASSFTSITRAFRIRLWKPLHRLVYAAWLFASIHVFISPHLDVVSLSLLASMPLVLLLLRVFAARQKDQKDQ